MHSKSWPYVYPGLHLRPDSELARIGANIPREDAQLIRSVATNNNVLSHIIQHAIKSAADYARANNLSLLDSDRFIEYLCKRTISWNPEETNESNDNGRDKGSLVTTTDVKIVAAITRQADATESGEGRGRGRTKGTEKKRGTKS